jgi:hypothetical protein
MRAAASFSLRREAGEEMAYKPIESYGVIGDMHTVVILRQVDGDDDRQRPW